MKRFYELYANNKKVAQLVPQIAWGSHILIMQKCKKPLERLYYIKTSIREGWSHSILQSAIEGQDFEKWAIQQINFDNQLDKNLVEKGKFLVKDDYNLGFLTLSKDHKERELEDGLVDNIVKFLAEMGGEFCFVGRQYHLEVGGEEFFIDLLFYHRGLKSLIAVELKADKFRPEHAGKMGFYLAVLDDQVKKTEENPSIGIVICKNKNRTIVEYALKNMNKPVGVSTYKFKELPEKIAKFLPSEKAIKKRLI